MRAFIVPVCVAVLGAVPAPGREGPAAPTDRYETVQVMPAQFALVDTTSGECWVEDHGRWVDLKFPVKDTKVADGKPGRFRLRALRDKEGNAVSLVVHDTTDGRCWRSDYNETMNWQAVRSPRGK
jgi:hypothetical protein